MPTVSFNGVLIIAAIAVLVPVVLGLLPKFPVPGAVLEVVAGIVAGPSVLLAPGGAALGAAQLEDTG